MPLNEYKCENCGHLFDKIQKFSDEPLTSCPICNEETLKKVISKSDFVLKGSGWYSTDYN